MQTPVIDGAFFRVGGCRDCDLPGYLVLESKGRELALADMPEAARREFGQTIATAERAVQVVTGADRVYVLRFSEGLASVHFHIVPRTAALADEWRRATGLAPDADIVGEQLFAWIRQEKRLAAGVEPSSATALALAAIRRYLSEPSA